jgi:hypothetical protein
MEDPGIEVMRVRIIEGRPWVELVPVTWMESPERWGSLLCEAMLHVANAYHLGVDYDFEETACRVFAGLHRRWHEGVEVHGQLMRN